MMLLEFGNRLLESLAFAVFGLPGHDGLLLPHLRHCLHRFRLHPRHHLRRPPPHHRCPRYHRTHLRLHPRRRNPVDNFRKTPSGRADTNSPDRRWAIAISRCTRSPRDGDMVARRRARLCRCRRVRCRILLCRSCIRRCWGVGLWALLVGCRGDVGPCWVEFGGYDERCLVMRKIVLWKGSNYSMIGNNTLRRKIVWLLYSFKSYVV